MDRQENQKKFDKPKVDWIEAKQFTDGDLKVIVKKLPVSRPKFSIEIGVLKNEKIMRFIPIMTSGQGKIVVESVSVRIQKMVDAAEQYILEESQKNEDSYIAYKIEREQRSMNRGKPETRHTGKTTAKKNKQRQNQAET